MMKMDTGDMTMEDKVKYKSLKEIVVNYVCVFGSLFVAFYIFRDFNASSSEWSFEFGLLIFYIEFMIAAVLAIKVTSYVRKKLGFEECEGVQVDVS